MTSYLHSLPLVECPYCQHALDLRSYMAWQDRCLDAERELERVTDELDSANERIAQLERWRDRWKKRAMDTDPYTGWPYGFC